MAIEYGNTKIFSGLTMTKGYQNWYDIHTNIFYFDYCLANIL